MAVDAQCRRRSVRQFEADFVIPHDQLEQIMHTAQIAPTANDLQAIDFLVLVDRAKIDAVSRIALESFPPGIKQHWESRALTYGNSNVVTSDASALVVLVKNERAASTDCLEIDAGIACQAIMCSAIDFGLDTLCIGIMKRGNTDALEEQLGIPRGSYIISVAIGKAKVNPLLGHPSDPGLGKEKVLKNAVTYL